MVVGKEDEVSYLLHDLFDMVTATTVTTTSKVMTSTRSFLYDDLVNINQLKSVLKETF